MMQLMNQPGTEEEKSNQINMSQDDIPFIEMLKDVEGEDYGQ